MNPTMTNPETQMKTIDLLKQLIGFNISLQGVDISLHWVTIAFLLIIVVLWMSIKKKRVEVK
jgi:hypothetical protein